MDLSALVGDHEGIGAPGAGDYMATAWTRLHGGQTHACHVTAATAIVRGSAPLLSPRLRPCDCALATGPRPCDWQHHSFRQRRSVSLGAVPLADGGDHWHGHAGAATRAAVTCDGMHAASFHARCDGRGTTLTAHVLFLAYMMPLSCPRLYAIKFCLEDA